MPVPRALDRELGEIADAVGFAVLWGWIITSLFFVPAWLGHWWLGAILASLGALVCWGAARATTHPVYAVGTYRDVEVEPIAEPGLDCDECGRPAGGGQRRRYVTRHVLFGTTVAVPEWGENCYCEACAVDPAASPADHDGGARRSRPTGTDYSR